MLWILLATIFTPTVGAHSIAGSGDSLASRSQRILQRLVAAMDGSRTPHPIDDPAGHAPAPPAADPAGPTEAFDTAAWMQRLVAPFEAVIASNMPCDEGDWSAVELGPDDSALLGGPAGILLVPAEHDEAPRWVYRGDDWKIYSLDESDDDRMLVATSDAVWGVDISGAGRPSIKHMTLPPDEAVWFLRSSDTHIAVVGGDTTTLIRRSDGAQWQSEAVQVGDFNRVHFWDDTLTIQAGGGYRCGEWAAESELTWRRPAKVDEDRYYENDFELLDRAPSDTWYAMGNGVDWLLDGNGLEQRINGRWRPFPFYCPGHAGVPVEPPTPTPVKLTPQCGGPAQWKDVQIGPEDDVLLGGANGVMQLSHDVLPHWLYRGHDWQAHVLGVDERVLIANRTAVWAYDAGYKRRAPIKRLTLRPGERVHRMASNDDYFAVVSDRGITLVRRSDGARWQTAIPSGPVLEMKLVSDTVFLETGTATGHASTRFEWGKAADTTAYSSSHIPQAGEWVPEEAHAVAIGLREDWMLIDNHLEWRPDGRWEPFDVDCPDAH
jgi:hypothetical protein